MHSVSERFRSFLNQARRLQLRPNATAPLGAFGQLIRQAEQSLIGPLQRDSQKLAKDLETLRPWLISSRLDLLAVAGLSFDENAYTELVRWALCGEANPN